MTNWRSVLAGTVLVAATLAAGAAVWYVQTAEPRLARDLERWLSERLNSEVSIDTLDVTLFPAVRIEGVNLVLRIKGRPDLSPFITIRKWTGTGDLLGLWNHRLQLVRIEGAEIVVPPGRKQDLKPLSVNGGTDGGSSPTPQTGAPIVDRLEADHVLITVQPRDADRDPVVWDVRDLAMRDFSLETASPFSATVDTPLQKDRAYATGTAGPWPRRDLQTLPLQGEYTFDGDLGSVPGLEGEIHVEGSALGALERLETAGKASSPGLGLSTKAGGRLPLTASYQGIFDGTSGDLALTRLTTQLGASTFDLTGSVLRRRGVRGRHVKLQASTPKPANLGDVMRLLVDGRNAPLTGRLGLRARLDIPPGENDVQDRLTVDGTFDVSQARFRDREIQERIDVLSRRGQGRPADPTIAGVAADMEGQAVLRRRDLALSGVRFVVPGVAIEISGRYGLSSQRLDFHGIARLDATFSQTQTGARRLLLRPIDPLFRKDGAGTRLVVGIVGTREAPKVDVNLRASLRSQP
jgi:hypothetical protein